MQCSCGGTTVFTTRELITHAGVSKWLRSENHDINSAILRENKCSDCGRLLMELWSNNELLAKRG